MVAGSLYYEDSGYRVGNGSNDAHLHNPTVLRKVRDEDPRACMHHLSDGVLAS